jgi:hypothetical protein
MAVSAFIFLRYPSLRHLNFKGLEPPPAAPLPSKLTPPVG